MSSAFIPSTVATRSSLARAVDGSLFHADIHELSWRLVDPALSQSPKHDTGLVDDHRLRPGIRGHLRQHGLGAVAKASCREAGSGTIANCQLGRVGTSARQAGAKRQS